MRITPIPAFNDNYIWLLQEEAPKASSAAQPCVVVDPGDAKPVLAYLQQHNLRLDAILITHHHWDHTGGVQELLQHYPCPVIGPASENIASISHTVREGEQFTLFAGQVIVSVLECPGHTLDHIAFYSAPHLFCGDTLFAAGCGRMFEGEPKQFLHSLNKLAALPADTKVFCGHEYTQANLAFAHAVEPDNLAITERIKQVAAQRLQHQPSLPCELAEEHATNPFLRAHLPSVMHAAEAKLGKPLTQASDVFAVLREWKNNF
ncbi:hydroxyacylglutathione hydrolase [Aliidiomarina sp.]|uniref:hydroxyacylglutathione hydrolase n=1 Tax=Aliidiomarina sp. TaxID=1872439 RepID=UPI003A4E14D3